MADNPDMVRELLSRCVIAVDGEPAAYRLRLITDDPASPAPVSQSPQIACSGCADKEIELVLLRSELAFLRGMRAMYEAAIDATHAAGGEIKLPGTSRFRRKQGQRDAAAQRRADSLAAADDATWD
jgi:hypothetical protein